MKIITPTHGFEIAGFDFKSKTVYLKKKEVIQMAKKKKIKAKKLVVKKPKIKKP